MDVQVIKGWYAALPGEMQQVMKSRADKPYTIDRNALPQDSRAPAEASARVQSRVVAIALRNTYSRPSRLEYRSSFYGRKHKCHACLALQMSTGRTPRFAL